MNANAILIQICTTLIARARVQCMGFNSTHRWSLSNLFVLLRQEISFTARCDLGSMTRSTSRPMCSIPTRARLPLLSLTSTLTALSSQALRYDANDRLAVDTYDANGNTVASGGKAFAYEFEDRLTSYDNDA
jgi:hypothetical protein